jgi:hypothetical protein
LATCGGLSIRLLESPARISTSLNDLHALIEVETQSPRLPYPQVRVKKPEGGLTILFSASPGGCQ